MKLNIYRNAFKGNPFPLQQLVCNLVFVQESAASINKTDFYSTVVRLAQTKLKYSLTKVLMLISE